MSTINIENGPIYQSGYTYLQVAGSNGADQTVSGFHLKWDFLRILGDSHLPKGDYTEEEAYETTIGYNRPSDYVKIYKTKFDSGLYHISIDTSATPVVTTDVNGRWNWEYDIQVSGFGGFRSRKVRFVFMHTENYDAITGGGSVSDWQNFLATYDGIVELRVDDNASTSGAEDRLAFYYEFTTTQPNLSLPFLLRVEAVGTPDSSDPATKQINVRKKYTSASETKKFYSENTEFVRFDSQNAKITNIKLITYQDFIVGINSEDEREGAWEEVYATGQPDGFALTLDDTEMNARFKADFIDGVSGHWPKFNEPQSSGAFQVRKTNYFNRWRRQGFTFNPSDPENHDFLGLQNFIHDYLSLSTTDVKAMVDLQSDIENDASVQTVSCLDMLKLVSLDFHVTRMLGLGHIDQTVSSDEYVYCMVYTTTAGLDGTYSSAAQRTHLYMALPANNTTYRLPKAPVLDECTFGVEIANGTDNPAAITDEEGYAPHEPIRFININRKKYNHEYAFGPFFNRIEEFDLSLETQPIAYGLEYKELNETAYRKPEISHDTDYTDNAGIPETVPIMENGTPRIFTHQEDENGTHVYSAYAINWFSRVSPLSNTKEVTTAFPPHVRLLPPFNYAVQLIQDEDPSETEIINKTLMLTTQAEQQLLADLPENTDHTLVRTTFDWNHVHNHAHPTVDFAEFFFREDEPSVVKGKIAAVTTIDADTALIQTGSYQISSVFPAETVQPAISNAESGKYIGSFLTSGSSHYVIEGFQTYGNNPSIRVRVLKQNQASAPDPANQNQFLSQETIQLPEVGDLFFLIENTGDPTNWDLKHTDKVYIEKHYFNESVKLRYSPTLAVSYPINSLIFDSGNTSIVLETPLKSTETTGVTVEFMVQPRIVSLTPNTVTLQGDWTSITSTNTTFQLLGSEFNEGTYTIASASYSTTTLLTTIHISGFFPNGILSDGVVRMTAHYPLAGLSIPSNRVIVSGDIRSQINLANIEYVTENDGSQSRFVVGGVNLNVDFQPLLDDQGNGTGYIQVFTHIHFEAHPDSRVNWYKGTVRLTDVSGKKQTYPVSYIGNLTSTPSSYLCFVIQDPGFIPSTVSDPEDSYSFDLNTGQTVNFHPSYRLYLKTSNGVHPVTGAAIPGGGVHFDEEATLVQGNNPLLISKQTLMSVRSVDSVNGYHSFLSSPVVLFAQKIAVPLAPEQPQGPIYATRPDYYGKSSYTFDTKVNTDGRSPYSMVFYRASDDAILDMLYTPETIGIIKEAFEELPDSFVNDQQLWEILIHAIPDPSESGMFKTLTTTDGEFTWPLPDNQSFYVQYESSMPLSETNPGVALCRPFNGLLRLTGDPDGIADVYGTEMTGAELIKLAVQNAFTPLNEQPPLFGHFWETSRQTSPAPSVIRDTNGDLLDPGVNDIYPMIRKFTDNGDTIVRFTDYSLDGSSINKYFYRAMELDDKFKFSPPSDTLGPVLLVNSFAPDQPQIRKVLTQLPNAVTETPTAVLFELNPYISRLEIAKFEIYRATNEDDALSVRTMQKVKVIAADQPILDDFENDPFPLYGEQLFYRLVAIREVTDVADVMQSDQTLIVDAPSKPSGIVSTTIVDPINPEAPDLTFVFGSVTPEAYVNVQILWSATCYNGTYSLQKMNSSGNWNEVFKVKKTTGPMQYPPLPGDFGYSSSLSLLLIREDEDENPIYHRYRVVVENSSGLFNLIQKEFIVGESHLIQEDFSGTIDLEDNSGSINN